MLPFGVLQVTMGTPNIRRLVAVEGIEPPAQGL